MAFTISRRLSRAFVASRTRVLDALRGRYTCVLLSFSGDALCRPWSPRTRPAVGSRFSYAIPDTLKPMRQIARVWGFRCGPERPGAGVGATMRAIRPAQARVQCEQNDGVADGTAGTDHLTDSRPERGPGPPQGEPGRCSYSKSSPWKEIGGHVDPTLGPLGQRRPRIYDPWRSVRNLPVR